MVSFTWGGKLGLPGLLYEVNAGFVAFLLCFYLPTYGNMVYTWGGELGLPGLLYEVNAGLVAFVLCFCLPTYG
jgi:hypothetical protein